MIPELTIVMYHYVRPLHRSRFPAIKGLDVALFDEQLEYLDRHYSIVSMGDVLDALDGRGELSARPVLLTFDDGYLDHYTYVFPRLAERGVSGAFFPPAMATMDRKVLDVNKIHFALAAAKDVGAIVEFIEEECAQRRRQWDLAELSIYREKYWKAGLDTAPVAYIKRMLQVGLPQGLRSQLASELFERHVSTDETAFAEELYVSIEQLRLMVASGMHVGSHGNGHRWLGTLTATDQEAEIDGSLRLLRAVGMSPEHYTICYPYGDHDARTLAIVAARGFKAGLTTRVAVASVCPEHRFTLPRLDTNDLPKSRDATGDKWMHRAP